MGTEKDIQDELNKAARLINAILRLMHKGAIQHEQARQELNALPKGIAKTEIEFCVRQAMDAIDINDRNTQKKYADPTAKIHW